MPLIPRLVSFVLLVLALSAPVSSAGIVGVFVTPKVASIRAGSVQQFSASVYFTSNKSVVWRVNGVVGGSAATGIISATGRYTAPAAPPPTAVSITATSVADPAAAASASITILNPLPTVSFTSPSTVAPGPFTIAVRGSGFVTSSTVRIGGVDLPAVFVSSTQLTVSGVARPTPGGLLAVRVSNPDPGAAVSGIGILRVAVPAPLVSTLAAARFLEQISWGPTPASLARVQQVGFRAYLDEQFARPASSYPDYPSSVTSLRPVQQRFAVNAVSGDDQLRQRVAFALSQIFVVSGFKSFLPQMYVPYLRLLHEQAFGSFPGLLRDMTRSPTMGHFLDLVNNEKANPAQRTEPNRNYARELLQLFTLGTDLLHADGTPVLDAQGRPVPAYDEAAIDGIARALTGWTYPTKPGATALRRNPMYFTGPMEPVPASHDTDAKVLLDGRLLPAGQTAEQDLDDVVAMLASHPNVAPFITRRLIQALVTSQPSRAYVERVSAVFRATDGDLPSVIRAIVLDVEARRGDLPGSALPGDGHLREPVLLGFSLLRALDATVPDASVIVNILSPAGQSLFYPPSVFGYFSPLFVLPETGALAPEFQILTPSTAVYRANLAYYATFAPEGAGVELSVAPFDQFADDPARLVEAVNQALLAGRMPPEMRAAIEAAVAAVTPIAPWLRAETALQLVAASALYQVQR